MGGGSAPKAKPETMQERNARLLSGRKSNSDALALLQQSDFLKTARRRSSLFSGSETGSVASGLGGGMTRLGSM